MELYIIPVIKSIIETVEHNKPQDSKYYYHIIYADYTGLPSSIPFSYLDNGIEEIYDTIR